MEFFLQLLIAILYYIFLPLGLIVFIVYLGYKSGRKHLKICPNCRMRIHKEANICHHCHYKLN